MRLGWIGVYVFISTKMAGWLFLTSTSDLRWCEYLVVIYVFSKEEGMLDLIRQVFRPYGNGLLYGSQSVMAFFIRGRSFKILPKGSSTKFASYISNEFKQINQLLFSLEIIRKP